MFLRDLDSRNGTYEIIEKKLIPFACAVLVVSGLTSAARAPAALLEVVEEERSAAGQRNEVRDRVRELSQQADVVFGGGTWVFGRLKRGVRVGDHHEPITAPLER